jgi:hypothetical protein
MVIVFVELLEGHCPLRVYFALFSLAFSSAKMLQTSVFSCAFDRFFVLFLIIV